MKKVFLISLVLVLAFGCAVFASQVYASEVKPGDKVTIVTPGTVARLCPYPNCRRGKHIIRIPEGTVLEVEGIIDVKSQMLSVEWFEVTYKEKRGWISVSDTHKAK